MPRKEANLFRYPALLPPLLVLGPRLWQKQPLVHQSVPDARGVCQVDAHLAVVDLAEPAAPLSLDAHRRITFLRVGRWVKHQHPVRFAQGKTDLPSQFHQQGLVIPRTLADKLLQSLPLLVAQVSDRFHVLPLQARHQARQVVPRVLFLFGLLQTSGKGLHKLLQPRQHAPEHRGSHHRIVKQLAQPNLKASFHRSLLSGDPFP